MAVAMLDRSQQASRYRPLEEVRRTLRVKWYRSPIDPKELRALMQRSDGKGLFQTLGVLALLTASGVITYYFVAQQMWVAFAIALFVHGTMVSNGSGANHELTHGTVFRTKWLNRVFLRLYALLFWFNHYDYAMSHTYHHRYTLHTEGDREEVLPHSTALRFLRLLQMSTLDVTGGPHTNGLIPTLRLTVRTAIGRPLSDYTHLNMDKLEWTAAIYEGHPEERRKSVRWARAILAFHAAVLVVAVVLQLWLLPLLISFAPFVANFWRWITHLPMHNGLRTNVPDFRKCTRSIKLDPLTSLLYARMNWHLEHHMYAGVPCYNLRKLHRAIAADVPEPKSVIGAWREMRATWRRQQVDPDYQYDTPLPPTANPSPTDPAAVRSRVRGTEDEQLRASIGDLAPAVIAD